METQYLQYQSFIKKTIVQLFLLDKFLLEIKSKECGGALPLLLKDVFKVKFSNQILVISTI